LKEQIQIIKLKLKYISRVTKGFSIKIFPSYEQLVVVVVINMLSYVLETMIMMNTMSCYD